MTGKCANSLCSAFRYRHGEGKLFRIDVDLGKKSGEHQWKTAYVWLCSRCAREMYPKIEVAGDAVRVRLAKIEPSLLSQNSSVPARVN